MNWKLVLAVLVVNIFFMSASYTMIVPFLPLYLSSELGADEASLHLWSGLVFSASFIVSAVMAPLWGHLADTHGKRLMALRASFLLAVSYFLGGIVETPFQLMLMRIFQGFASGLWAMDLAIMTVYAPPDKLGFSLGVMQSCLTAGGILGPLLGGVLASVFGMRPSFFVASCALFGSFLIFLLIIKEPPAPKTPKEETEKIRLWRIPIIRNMLITATLVQVVIFILQPIITTYVGALAGPIDNLVLVAGIVFSLGGIAGVIAAPFWGSFGQKKGFFLAMMMGMSGAALTMLLQGWTPSLYLFGALQFIGGLFMCAIMPAINALLAENTPASHKGRIFGLLFAVQQFGAFLGPLLGGVIATYLGMNYVFITAGLLLLAIAALIYRRYGGRRGADVQAL